MRTSAAQQVAHVAPVHAAQQRDRAVGGLGAALVQLGLSRLQEHGLERRRERGVSDAVAQQQAHQRLHRAQHAIQHNSGALGHAGSLDDGFSVWDIVPPLIEVDQVGMREAS